ncbi:unnamed protein product [Prorocentrum cordatum]|uniref:Uncharacterized protein n=1 Tax=Prorocentrum cordatum TaxID=2364126 RepID=A0ABN9XPV4_9DINO|nr:unnamed protein product [Polarella glacialis]
MFSSRNLDLWFPLVRPACGRHQIFRPWRRVGIEKAESITGSTTNEKKFNIEGGKEGYLPGDMDVEEALEEEEEEEDKKYTMRWMMEIMACIRKDMQDAMNYAEKG